jgi:hypothetical protein
VSNECRAIVSGYSTCLEPTTGQNNNSPGDGSDNRKSKPGPLQQRHLQGPAEKPAPKPKPEPGTGTGEKQDGTSTRPCWAVVESTLVSNDGGSSGDTIASGDPGATGVTSGASSNTGPEISLPYS